mgnify:CR=1 FL=1
MQERTRAQAKVKLGSGLLCHRFDGYLIQCLYRALGLALGRAEGGEIVPPDQMCRAGPHRVGIQRIAHLPNPAPVQNSGRRHSGRLDHWPLIVSLTSGTGLESLSRLRLRRSARTSFASR